ncbi:hypothetical protein E0K99_01795 [Faecalicoccus pleomorphus]|uniref:serine hydrolase n=2 Tax=Faecalicoccus pleomorphus TaxID=1323 RepID=UPI00143113B7|nr:serine hydrolase [Faecalicoccus pleomorphus]MBM6677623.1 serine hydrolase [Faecalicoccus pleomorphus]NJE40055.1 hypothetical protein [Faecalicoccus pleomorphus]
MHLVSNLNKSTKKIMFFAGLMICLLLFSCILFVFYSSQKTGFVPASLFDSSHIIYIDKDHEQLYGSQKIGEDLYYFDEETGYMHTGFLETENGTYYYDENGKQVIGLQTIDSDQYYFADDGRMKTSCFQSIASDLYYFDEDGKMVTGKTTIHGISYIFDENGKLQLDIASLQTQIQSILSTYPGNNAVYFKDLDTEDSFLINDLDMYPCSIIKIFVMGAVYDQIDQGNLKLEDCRPYLEAMIIHSDNTSYNILLEKLGNGDGIAGASKVTAFCKKLGLTRTEIHHGLEPGDGYFSDGQNNTTCPEDVGQFFEMLYHSEIVSDSSCKDMLNLLKQCADDTGMVAGLSEDTECAHKSGWADAYYLDGGIIYTEHKDYILVVFSDSAYQTPAQEISQYVFATIQSLYASS